MSRERWVARALAVLWVPFLVICMFNVFHWLYRVHPGLFQFAAGLAGIAVLAALASWLSENL